MRLIVSLKTIMVIAVTFVTGICTPSYAQSPYAIFGDNSRILEAKKLPVPNIYHVEIRDNDGASYYAEFDFRQSTVTVYDRNGNAVSQDTISKNDKARFTTVDPEAEKYLHLSPYNYCGNNSVNAIDSDGRKIIFINGLIGGSPPAGAQYWYGSNSSFVKGAKQFFNDQNISFSDKNYTLISFASQRRKKGYEYAQSMFSKWTSTMEPEESFKLVSHSMGGAFSMGIEDYIKEQGREVEYNVMINTYQVDKINIDNHSSTFYIDYQNTNDPVLFWFDINLGFGELKNADLKIREKSQADFMFIHRSPIENGDFWKKIKEILER